MGGECELERIKETREESLARESYPSAEAAARPLREPLRAAAFAEPAFQRTVTTTLPQLHPGLLFYGRRSFTNPIMIAAVVAPCAAK